MIRWVSWLTKLWEVSLNAAGRHLSPVGYAHTSRPMALIPCSGCPWVLPQPIAPLSAPKFHFLLHPSHRPSQAAKFISGQRGATVASGTQESISPEWAMFSPPSVTKSLLISSLLRSSPSSGALAVKTSVASSTLNIYRYIPCFRYMRIGECEPLKSLHFALSRGV